MTAFLARSISTAKWKAKTNIAANEISADAVTHDMRTIGNTLSFWLYDPAREGSLEEAALALASIRDNIQRLDLVWVDQKIVEQINLRVESTQGETPARHLKSNHRDVIGLDVTRLMALAQNLANALINNQTRRFTEKQIHTLLCNAAKNNLIAMDDLKSSVAEKIKCA